MEAKTKLRRKGWNWYAFFFNILWYFKYGIISKAIMMLVITLFSLGAALIPIAIYCGIKGNRDRYNYISRGII